MAGLLAIPFEMQVHIIRLLSLKDCISYMQVCTVTHDVVCYVFAHRKELDFESVLDDTRTILLCPEMLMKVLYAHSRAVSIVNFCLNPTFTMLDEFCRYFNLYWSYKGVEPYQFGDFEVVGHPSGHLEHIRYLGRRGDSGGSTREQSAVLGSLWRGNQDWFDERMICEYHEDSSPYLKGSEANWSCVDVDAPYTWCRECYGVCSCSMEINCDEEELLDGDECVFDGDNKA